MNTRTNNEAPKSWKVEVQTTGKWAVAPGLRFKTKADAEKYGRDLGMRWARVLCDCDCPECQRDTFSDVRATPSGKVPNRHLVSGRFESIPTE